MKTKTVVCWDNFCKYVEIMQYKMCNANCWHNVIIMPEHLKNENKRTVEYWNEVKSMLKKEYIVK